MPEKEIGKLLELLNEYDGDVLEYGFVDGCIRRKVKNFNNEKNTWKSVVWYTKEFGFIQRLVEQDKIDLGQKLFNLTKNDNRKSIICDLDSNDFSWEDTFLMLLSISDTPIEDLISYLK